MSETADQRLMRASQRAQAELDLYLEQSREQHGQAMAALAKSPPNYSAAATACHRALQFHRQAEALAWVQMELRA